MCVAVAAWRDMAESQTEELVAKRNSTSIIWNWFGFSATDQAQANVICKVCTETVRTSGGNTTNLFTGTAGLGSS